MRTWTVNRSAGGTQVTVEQNPDDEAAAGPRGTLGKGAAEARRELSSSCTDIKSGPFPPLALTYSLWSR